MDLNGKFFLVTGGNSGIGLATAQSLVEAGARVAIFGRDQVTIDAAVDTLGGSTIGVAGDVSRNEDLDRLFADVELGGQNLTVCSSTPASSPPRQSLISRKRCLTILSVSI